MANYTSQRDGATIAFASTVPGSIMPVDLKQMPNGLMIQKGAFLCAEDSVETSVAFNKKFGAGLFGGEGFILQKAIGNGNVFLEVDGDPIERDFAQRLIPFMPTSNNSH